MNKRELRAEYNLRKERRSRSIKRLIEEAIVNVLAEQEVQQKVQSSPQTPPPVATPTNQPEPEPDPSLDASPSEPVQKQYTVDDMIDELNIIRGGHSFTDPEVYGKLITFFKGLDDEHKSVLDDLLTQVAELVTGVEEEEDSARQQSVDQASPSQDQQAKPPVETPQKQAPMPGAQKAAGAAGVGEV